MTPNRFGLSGLVPKRRYLGLPVSGWPAWWAPVGWAAGVVCSSFLVAVATGLNVVDDGLRFVAAQSGLWTFFALPALLGSARFGTGSLVTDFGLRLAPAEAVRAVLLGVAVQFCLPILYFPVRAVGLNPDLSGPAKDLLDGLSSYGVVLVLIGVVVCAPIFEELLFRGVLLRALEDRFEPGIAIGLSAAIFAATHLQVWQFPALFVVGAVFAWVAVRTGGLAFAVWTHIGFNATTAVVLLST